MTSRSDEDYLKALYILSQNRKVVSTSEISEYFEIAPSSVTEMLKKLSAEGYVRYWARHGATLTDKGLEVAQQITRKHRLLERFLHDILKIGKDEVHKQACQMEHSLSDEAAESLCRLLKHPGTCPDEGRLIPPCDLPFSNCEECIAAHKKGLEEVGRRKQDLVSVSTLKEGSMGRISFIRGERKVLQRLLDMGLTPGTCLSVVRVAPLKGPIEVAVRGSKLALGQDVASNVFVKTFQGNQ